MDGRSNLRLCNVILDVQIMLFGPKSLYDGVAPLVIDPPCAYFTTMQNPPICNPHIALTQLLN